METSDSAPDGTAVHRYRLFGVTMASDYPFANPLPRVSGSPDLTFTCTRAPPVLTRSENDVVCSSAKPAGNEEPVQPVRRTGDGYVVHVAGSADFSLFPDRIIAHLSDPALSHMVEISLLGDIFSLWLELRGIRSIHASAVVAGDDAVAFLSTNMGGKTALAAAFLQQGHRLLTDDVLAVEERHGRFLGRPGYPALRMWPDQAKYFVGAYEKLDIVHPVYSKRRIPVGHHGFGTFCPDERPLRVLYLPERQDPDHDISIIPVSRKKAFFSLLSNSFTAGIVEALGGQQERMEFFSRLVRQVPVRRLHYPEGFHHLPRVVAAVREDVSSL